MKVVNPNDTTFLIYLITRYDLSGDLKLYIKDIDEDEYTITVLSSLLESELEAEFGEQDEFYYAVIGGVLNLSFDYAFSEGKTYDLKVVNNDILVYKGHIFATSQDKATYELTKNAYKYE